jgi:hypothetical protein
MKAINPKGFFETLGGLSTQLGEMVLDEWLSKLSDDKIFKQLPVINSILSPIRATLSIRDRLFMEKVRVFFESRDQHTPEERENFVRKLDTNPKERQRLAEAITLLLDQFDDMEKPVLFARAFSAYIRQAIDPYHFRRYGEIIKAATVVHLQNLYLSLKDEAGDNRPIYSFPSDQGLPLSALGLIELRNEGPVHLGFRTPPQPGKTVFCVSNDFGRKFVKIIIRKEDIDESED